MYMYMYFNMYINTRTGEVEGEWSEHSHQWGADLPGQPLWVQYWLAGAPAGSSDRGETLTAALPPFFATLNLVKCSLSLEVGLFLLSPPLHTFFLLFLSFIPASSCTITPFSFSFIRSAALLSLSFFLPPSLSLPLRTPQLWWAPLLMSSVWTAFSMSEHRLS